MEFKVDFRSESPRFIPVWEEELNWMKWYYIAAIEEKSGPLFITFQSSECGSFYQQNILPP